MAYWEFLLQKEGDRDWLPLETAHVEISEGRYRIIAHTSYCEVPVDIRLSQLLANQMPPRRKTLKRVGHTNKNGLMVVIPFTHLTPGSWTVKCGGVAANEAGERSPWQYGVQLQVLAIESGVEYWDTDLDEEALAEQLAAEPTAETGATATSEESATSPSSPPASSSDAIPPEAVSSPPLPSETFKDATPLADLPLRLQLQYQALVAHSRTSVVLQGQVTSFSQVEGLPGEGTLWVQLRNPETGAVIHQETKAVSIASLPHRFELPLNLPEGISTRLLVGELSLWTATEPPQILAIQGFTVTLNLDALLEVVANQAERSPDAAFEDLTPAATPEERAPAASEAPESEGATEAVQAKALAPPPAREIPFRLIYLPSTGLTLPPVIYRPVDKKAVGAPSLPPMGNQQRRVHPQTSAEAPTTPNKPLTLPPIGKPRSASSAAQETPSDAETSTGPDLELPTLGRSRNSAAATPEETPSPAPETTAKDSSDLTFQPDFQGRFWHRLSALAEEAQKAAADYKAQLEAAGVEADSENVASPQIDLPFPTFQEDAGNLNYEVVVYEPEELESALTEAVTEPLVEVLQPGDPDVEDLGAVPIPELLMSQGELIAGAPLPITVRLPIYPRRLAVKVWVTDIQSRTLIDRPRWLMNWSPSDEGQQTALLQLQVPLGSIEARFEAIAIDLATQRESYKATEVRSILPPNLPETDIDSVI